MIAQDVIKCFQKSLEKFSDKNDILENSLRFLRSIYGASAIGIRLREGHDYPYYTTMGFSDLFVRTENYLCPKAREAVKKNGDLLYDPKTYPCLECMCGCVISEHTDNSLPYFTKYGSFYTGSTTALMGSLSNEEREKLRNRCNTEGYETVFLVPLKYNGYNIGLIQMNDIMVDAFTEEDRETIEAIAGFIASSIGFVIEKDNSKEKKREILKSELIKVMTDLRAMIKEQLAKN